MRKFDYSIAVLDKLIWKCQMTNEEIHDTLSIMNNWLSINMTGGFEWYTPLYGVVTHNEEIFLPCVCFEYSEDADRFTKRFGCVR